MCCRDSSESDGCDTEKYVGCVKCVEESGSSSEAVLKFAAVHRCEVLFATESTMLIRSSSSEHKGWVAAGGLTDATLCK